MRVVVLGCRIRVIVEHSDGAVACLPLPQSLLQRRARGAARRTMHARRSRAPPSHQARSPARRQACLHGAAYDVQVGVHPAAII